MTTAAPASDHINPVTPATRQSPAAHPHMMDMKGHNYSYVFNFEQVKIINRVLDVH